MPIDSSIANSFQMPQFESPMNGLAKVMQLQHLQQQGQLGQLKMDEARRANEGDNALARLLADGKTPDQVATGLASAGFGKQSLAYTKQQQELAGKQADTQKTQMEAATKRLDMAGQAFGYVRSNPTPDNALAVLDYLGSQGVFNPQQVAQYKQQIAANPQGVQQLADMAFSATLKAKDQLMQFQTRNTGGSTDTLGIDPVTGKTSVLNSVKNTQSPDSVASTGLGYAKLAEDQRHHGVTEAQGGKAPPGYRLKPDGTMEAIPGGPADLKMQGALNQDTQALTGSISSFDRLGTAANQVLNHPGLAGITGIRGKIPNVPGSAAADAEALLATLKSQVGFGVLQDMRNNSKTGGALGSVSDAEGKRLEANLAALDKAQSLEQFKQSLKAIVEYSDKAKDRVREAYNLKHGGRAQPPTGAPAAKPSLDDIFK